jgi:hypothetical protein
MPEPDLFMLFVRPLNALGAPYMVSGSIAAMLYGEPRLTNDVDIIVFLTAKTVSELTRSFSSEDFYCPPAEVIALETFRPTRGHANIIHIPSGYKADLYVSTEDPLHVWGMSRARSLRVGDEMVRVAPPEYVIVRKLEFYREGGSEKHIRDIRSMLKVSKGLLDPEQLEKLIEERGLEDAWAKAQEGLGEGG